ncbi:hypothetical protein OX283_009495 [Flavobacterium sp. SUN052]|uniref:hypothetical protein n=1 Tax=Flavobacterium sp. SUN052 TaxID=3002441 RepID=UPI00237E2EC5|nr:hypothetical protein [Flavobacterium sp. SUN052]MEC4004888.1 hypothetical protein [Flavobacterium sp. SUN052]
MNWSLTITAASFLLILSNSYYKLKGNKKIAYLFFFPAWIFFGFSIEKYNELSNDIILIKLLYKETPDYQENFNRLTLEINNLYSLQTENFFYGISVIILAITLIIIFFILDKQN